MSTYKPPRLKLPIFNTEDFISLVYKIMSGGGSGLYVDFPVAQGDITLQGVTLNGLLENGLNSIDLVTGSILTNGVISAQSSPLNTIDLANGIINLVSGATPKVITPMVQGQGVLDPLTITNDGTIQINGIDTAVNANNQLQLNATATIDSSITMASARDVTFDTTLGVVVNTGVLKAKQGLEMMDSFIKMVKTTATYPADNQEVGFVNTSTTLTNATAFTNGGSKAVGNIAVVGAGVFILTYTYSPIVSVSSHYNSYTIGFGTGGTPTIAYAKSPEFSTTNTITRPSFIGTGIVQQSTDTTYILSVVLNGAGATSYTNAGAGLTLTYLKIA
jgi:hypothetical protein